jgi:hypothetical protein
VAERLNKRHSAMVRQKIQASVILERFHKHFLGKLELSPTQIKVGECLLDRSVPKLSQIQHTGDEDNPIRARVSVEFVRPNP